jgi:hypothetical protein
VAALAALIILVAMKRYSLRKKKPSPKNTNAVLEQRSCAKAVAPDY